MGLFLSIAIYITLWWLCFMAVLPIGAQSLAERGESAEPGVERAAPKAPRLAMKAGLAAGLAALLWALVALGVAFDVAGFTKL